MLCLKNKLAKIHTFCLPFVFSIFMSTIHGFANKKIKRHNGTSTITYAITLHRHFSHR